MSNFDLIDDYLTNRLSESEREQFEEGMNADPALKSEVVRQSVIVGGIKRARAAELKAMLDRVPLESVSLWSDWSPLKVAATIGVAGLIGTGIYFFSKNADNSIQPIPSAEVPMDSLLPKDDGTQAPAIEDEKKGNETNEISTEEKKETATPQIRRAKPKVDESTSPKVKVNDPSSDMITEEKTTEQILSEKATISLSTIKVDKVVDNNQYTFHYQFEQGKLYLYGPFNESLYEILEVHGTQHALFLFFKDNFYHLDETKIGVTELTPIREKTLISKLKEFRKLK